MDTRQLKKDIKRISTLTNIHLIFRGHHTIEDSLNKITIPAQVAPSDIDTNTLLSIIDILVTDYSSICFDFMVLRRPIIYYTYDKETYEKERGLYFPIENLGGYLCKNQTELMRALKEASVNLTIDSQQNNAMEKFTSYDDGKASLRIIDLIFYNHQNNINIVKSKPKKNILLYGGPFIPNGVTTSFINLLNHIDKELYTITIIIEPDLLLKDKKRIEQLLKLHNHINIIGRTGQIQKTVNEKKLTHNLSLKYILSNNISTFYQKIYDREFIRIFGKLQFDTVINFEGYNTFWVSILTSKQQNSQKNAIYLHSDMLNEWKLRFPYLENNFLLYSLYDSLISVSKITMETNKKSLSTLFNLKNSQFKYCDNIQNPNALIQEAEEDINEDFFSNGNDRKVFINIGRLSPEKDQEKLISAFKIILEKYPNALLINLGDGPLKHHLRKLIKDLNLENNVLLLGQKLNPYPYLKKSDCFILSSNYEGQPVTLFEAMILQKPIIATDIPGNRAILENNPGLLVDNSIQGLVKGMQDFLDKRYDETKIFNYKENNLNALNMFYTKVLES